MSSEKRLADVDALLEEVSRPTEIMEQRREHFSLRNLIMCIKNAPTVDAVEVPDKKLLKAINLLIKQYEHSKNSDYVHSPVAHAFYYTWKQLDEKMDGDSNG